MSDLLRCPFCGSLPGTVVRVTQMGGGEDHVDFSIRCTDCGTDKTVRLKLKPTVMFGDVIEAMERAESEWNRREGEKDER